MNEGRAKGRSLTNEAAQFAIAFDRIGVELLTQLDGIPEQALYWPLPFPESNSLMNHILHLIEESKFWIVTVVGGQTLENTHSDLLRNGLFRVQNAFIMAQLPHLLQRRIYFGCGQLQQVFERS